MNSDCTKKGGAPGQNKYVRGTATSCISTPEDTLVSLMITNPRADAVGRVDSSRVTGLAGKVC